MYTLNYTRKHDATRLDVSLCALADHLGLAPLKELASKNCTTYIGYWGESYLSYRLHQIVELISMAYGESERHKISAKPQSRSSLIFMLWKTRLASTRSAV